MRTVDASGREPTDHPVAFHAIARDHGQPGNTPAPGSFDAPAGGGKIPRAGVVTLKRSPKTRWVPVSGLIGFDYVRRGGGSVSVQARDHRKRRGNQLSADSNQRDYALAA
ncbi:hypothetical protein GORHZ_098_00150 [Gordonia rhizosphera NBRC 16068]|uniref:Uncharacterized protein n=20 Tax=Mycobacteriales TaxID=85007 RepID=K6WDW5_9ACTN|nr:hypothetical protein GORHZ_098_00150 [Gordonia rhizosphera NBRC 16068]